MKKLNKYIDNMLNNIARKTQNFCKGIALMVGALIGIKRLGKDKYNLSQFYSVIIIFMLSSPPVLFFFGNIALLVWLGILLVSLALLNVDEVLMLSYLFSEFGVEEVFELNSYKEWIEDIYQESKSYLSF